MQLSSSATLSILRHRIRRQIESKKPKKKKGRMTFAPRFQKPLVE
jgi:hypothetical protein